MFPYYAVADVATAMARVLRLRPTQFFVATKLLCVGVSIYKHGCPWNYFWVCLLILAIKEYFCSYKARPEGGGASGGAGAHAAACAAPAFDNKD